MMVLKLPAVELSSVDEIRSVYNIIFRYW